MAHLLETGWIDKDAEIDSQQMAGPAAMSRNRRAAMTPSDQSGHHEIDQASLQIQQ
ncbi:hypothetical protein AB4Y42_37085 [Paraburkholderia sp. EG286B]|uniref:hypothetical protein n=1 Tax=Paraburkholderia sp. EG286B TaxID=3237011 RepID=UPI0034D168F3